MNRFRTTVLFTAAIVGLAGGVLLLTPGTELFGQDKKRGPLDVGLVNLNKFNKANLAVPGKDAKTPKVDLRSTISGQVAKGEKLSVFVAMNPFSETLMGRRSGSRSCPLAMGTISNPNASLARRTPARANILP